MAATLGTQHGASALLIEDKASGQSLIQELQRDTTLPVLPVKVDSDKVSRAYAVTPTIEAGRVFLPEGAPWVTEYVDEMANFPNAAHDDVVDSTTQALAYLAQSYNGPPPDYSQGPGVRSRIPGPWNYDGYSAFPGR
jgi:predicted phage terminase large subunit-like protein